MALGDISVTKLNASGIMSTRDFTGLTVGSFEVKNFPIQMSGIQLLIKESF